MHSGGIEPSRAPTLALAEFISSLDARTLSSNNAEIVGSLLLDYVRVASLGARMPWSEWARNYCFETGRSGASGVLFSSERLNPVHAGFLNTTFAGSIDADDTHVGAMLHPGAISFSTAFAVARQTGASGAEFVAAVVAGYETIIRIALSIQPSHFQRGFQSTATCGGFGATAAASRLLWAKDSDKVERTAGALGIVASFSGGLTQFYFSGSTVKRIHAAHAAASGLEAALMVKHGFSGPADILEGVNGFASAYSDAHDLSIVVKGLGTELHLGEVTVKGHSCSARVQAAVDALFELCRRHSVRSDDVEEITVGIPKVILGRLTTPNPVDVQAAQMSLPRSAALAVVIAERGGEGISLTVEDYERTMQDPVTVALEARIRCLVDPLVEEQTTAETVPARVSVRLKNGATHELFVPAPKGSPAHPFTRSEHVSRFRHELSNRWPERRCSELIHLSESLIELDDIDRVADLIFAS